MQLLPDRVDPLVNQVRRVAREYHAHVRRGDDTVTFTLNTGRQGVVTEPDLRLAERIDQAVAELGSGG